MQTHPGYYAKVPRQAAALFPLDSSSSNPAAPAGLVLQNPKSTQTRPSSLPKYGLHLHRQLLLISLNIPFSHFAE